MKWGKKLIETGSLTTGHFRFPFQKHFKILHAIMNTTQIYRTTECLTFWGLEGILLYDASYGFARQCSYLVWSQIPLSLVNSVSFTDFSLSTTPYNPQSILLIWSLLDDGMTKTYKTCHFTHPSCSFLLPSVCLALSLCVCVLSLLN